jgi:hypothetical protein
VTNAGAGVVVGGVLVGDEPDLRTAIAEHNRTTKSAMSWAASLVRTDAAYGRATARAGRRLGRTRQVEVGRGHDPSG